MKIRLLSVIAILIILASCDSHMYKGNSGKVPPGQAKKMDGSQSAKPYAPGQQKKNR